MESRLWYWSLKQCKLSTSRRNITMSKACWPNTSHISDRSSSSISSICTLIGLGTNPCWRTEQFGWLTMRSTIWWVNSDVRLRSLSARARNSCTSSKYYPTRLSYQFWVHFLLSSAPLHRWPYPARTRLWRNSKLLESRSGWLRLTTARWISSTSRTLSKDSSLLASTTLSS